MLVPLLALICGLVGIKTGFFNCFNVFSIYNFKGGRVLDYFWRKPKMAIPNVKFRAAVDPVFRTEILKKSDDALALDCVRNPAGEPVLCGEDITAIPCLPESCPSTHRECDSHQRGDGNDGKEQAQWHRQHPAGRDIDPSPVRV